MRRPLLGIVFCYLAGTVAGVRLAGPDFPAGLILAVLNLLLAFILTVAAAYFRDRDKLFALSANIFVCLAVFLAGWLAVDLRLRSPSVREIAVLMDKPREGVELIGMVTDDPELRAGRRDDKKYWSFAVDLEAISRVGVFQEARGEIQVRLPQTEIQPRYGERWRLTGVLIDNYRLADLSGQAADAQFRPQRFVFYADSQSAPVLLEKASRWSFRYWCFFIREKCSVSLSRGIEHRPDVVAILQALVLGRQYELSLPMREAFVATGTYHIFAISGQHVAIIALFIVFVLQIYGVGRLGWFYWLAPVLVVFTVMTGMSASAVRGCIMALMCFLGPMFKRKPDIASAMALAALLIVFSDPLQLFQAGFLLSFGIVAGLIILCPPLVEMSERLLAPDPYRLEPENWPARNARKIIRWVLFMLIASFASWLVSTPLIAHWFNLVSPVALLANLLVIPLATLVLLAGCLSILSGWFWPLAAEAFNFVNVVFVSLMAGLTGIMAKIPFGHIFVRSPPLWSVYLWLGVLVAWRVAHAHGLINYRRKKVWLAAVLVLVIAGVSARQFSGNKWEIHALNTGHGAVCLVNTDRAENILVNAGARYQARDVLKYLRKMGVNRLKIMVCPALDANHAGAAVDMIAALPIGEIYLGENKSRFAGNLTKAARGENIPIREIKAGEVFYHGNEFDLSSGASAATQAVVEITMNTGKPPPVIRIEEQPFSFIRPDAGVVAKTQACLRVIMRPTVEESQWPPRDWSETPAGRDVFLGPGQGIVFTPGRDGTKMTATTLFP